MKNPMTPEEMAQAVLDNAAGYDMQTQSLTSIDNDWMDRNGDLAGRDLNFALNKYRRKPEPMVRYTHVVSDDLSMTRTTLQEALDSRNAYNGEGTIHCLVEDTDWVEPVPEEKNPWQPIMQNEWPECKPNRRIVCRDDDGHTWENFAGNQGWNNPLAVEWKYAEDE